MRLASASSLALLSLVTLGVPACTNKSEASGAAGPAAGGSSVAVTADGDGFKPSHVKLKKGTPATLVFTRTTDETCATAVAFPELNIKKDLPKSTPVSISIPTDTERTLTFQCGMGMYKSSVVIAPN